MLRIYPVILDTLTALRPELDRIERRDSDLGRQLRRAAASVAEASQGDDARAAAAMREPLEPRSEATSGTELRASSARTSASARTRQDATTPAPE